LAVEDLEEMNDQELVYTGIEIVLLTEFPELTDRMKNTFGSYYDLTSETPQAYPVFGSVFRKFLIEKLLQDDSDELLGRIFLFCERMARSEDVEVVNLLWISILVPLIYNANQIKRAWKYMGHATRSVARDIAERRGWQSNLPSS
jgi:hypothetical protein